MDSFSFWAIVILALIALWILREIVCWYFKINEAVGLLRSIEESLKGSNQMASTDPLKNHEAQG